MLYRDVESASHKSCRVHVAADLRLAAPLALTRPTSKLHWPKVPAWSEENATNVSAAVDGAVWVPRPPTPFCVLLSGRSVSPQLSSTLSSHTDVFVSVVWIIMGTSAPPSGRPYRVWVDAEYAKRASCPATQRSSGTPPLAGTPVS